MKTKLIAVLICLFSLSVTVHAEDSAVIVVNENFSAYADGWSPSAEWVMDYATGADIKEGSIFLKARGTFAGASYEIPDSVKKHIKDSEYILSARIKAEGADIGILYATDTEGNTAFCIEPELIKQGEWNDVKIHVRPQEQSYDVIINGERASENAGYINKNSAGAAAIRFFAANDSLMMVESFTIETYDDSAVATVKVEFSDVSENSWARRYIMRLASVGIMLGTGDNTFSPKENMTVAQTAVILCRIFNISTKESDNWYSGAVDELTARGIYTDLTANEMVMRKDICMAAAMLLEERGITAEGAVKGKFVDLDGLSKEEEDSIMLLEALGVINGVSETELAPYAYVTREQAAKLFSSLIDVM